MYFDPDIWGPHYWFFLHTIAESYPIHPNEITKRKYYDLIINLPLFIPIDEMGNHFSRLLDIYPVSPYLDNRESFVKWMHFIHNKVNVHIGKPEISLTSSLKKYRNHYKSKPIKIFKNNNWKKHYLYILSMIILIMFIIVWYE